MATIASKRGLTEQVYEQIKENLFVSRYGKGGRLPVDDIAKEMNVSRQPVMDAIKRLELEGFVSVIPQVGCMVREYTPDEIHDFYQLFAYGEAQVAELAAIKADDEDIISLKIISEQIGQLSKQKPPRHDRARSYRMLNRKFHKEIRRIARSASLTELVESMGDRSDFFIAMSGRPVFAEEQRLVNAHVEHQEVLLAIVRHDARAAGEAMRHHILETDARLQEHYAGGKATTTAARASAKSTRAGRAKVPRAA
jgi:DNA-binding GntR family transcriptional regulator